MSSDGTKVQEDLGRALLGGDVAPRPGRVPAPVESWEPPCCGDIGLKIRADGIWLYQGGPIRREALVRLFASVLRKDVDGRTYLVTPVEKVLVAVEDAPFLAVAMEVDGEGSHQRLVFTTNVGDVVVCGPRHPLRFAEQEPGHGLKPYVLVRGRLDALLTRSLTFDLVALATGNAGGGGHRAGVWSSGAFFPL
jgi:hypothetical protein